MQGAVQRGDCPGATSAAASAAVAAASVRPLQATTMILPASYSSSLPKKLSSLTESLNLKTYHSNCLFAQRSVSCRIPTAGQCRRKYPCRRQHQAAWGHQPRPFQAHLHPLRPPCLPSRHLSRCPAARLSRLSLQQGRRPGLQPRPAPGQGGPLQPHQPQQARQPPLLRRLSPLGTLRHASLA